MDNVFETAEMMMQGMEIDEEFVKHIKQGLHGVKELMDVFSQYSSAKGLLKQKKWYFYTLTTQVLTGN